MKKPNYEAWFKRKMYQLKFRYIEEDLGDMNSLSFGKREWSYDEIRAQGFITTTPYGGDYFKYASRFLYKNLDFAESL